MDEQAHYILVSMLTLEVGSVGVWMVCEWNFAYGCYTPVQIFDERQEAEDFKRERTRIYYGT